MLLHRHHQEQFRPMCLPHLVGQSQQPGCLCLHSRLGWFMIPPFLTLLQVSLLLLLSCFLVVVIVVAFVGVLADSWFHHYWPRRRLWSYSHYHGQISLLWPNFILVARFYFCGQIPLLWPNSTKPDLVTGRDHDGQNARVVQCNQDAGRFTFFELTVHCILIFVVLDHCTMNFCLKWMCF